MQDMKSLGRGGILLRGLMTGTAILALAACENGLDLDMRGNLGGFSTTEAARTATANRPRPDDRHVDIEYLALCFAHFEPPVLDRLTEG